MDCNTQAPLSSTIFRSLLKFMSIELAMLSNHLILCCWLFILPSVFPSIRVFSSLHIRWPKYWVFSISPSNEYSRLISFRIDWFGLLAVQGTLKSVLQHGSLKGLYSWVLSLLYGPTLTSAHAYWKNHSFDSRTLVSKVVSLLFNTLSRFVIAFLPRSKCLSILWLQSPCTVILEPKKIKSVTISIVSPSVCHEVMGLDAMILVFWMLSFKPAFSLSSFTFMRLFNSSSLSTTGVVSSVYMRLFMFLPAVFILACSTSSLACWKIYIMYKMFYISTFSHDVLCI